jgi:hypothetical protein
MPGESVTLSRADIIAGWKRATDGTWSAPLSSRPNEVLRDNEPWNDFSYDPAAKLVSVRAGDPRLHLLECVVRNQAIDLSATKDVKIENISVGNLLPQSK